MFPAKAEKPEVLYEVKAQRGGFDKPDTLRCKGWKQETILRMLENNMENAEIPEMLVIYGGNGKCARNWESYYAIIESLKNLENDETLVIQSGMPVAVFKTHNLAPRVVMATTNIMKATWERFYDLQDKNLTIFAQYTAAPWEYIGTQGVIEGTFETLSAIVLKKGWDNDMHGKIFLTAGAGGMGGNQTWAGKMHGAVVILADADERVIDRRISKDYMDMKVHSLDEAWKIAKEHMDSKQPCAVAYHGNIVDLLEYLYNNNIHVDLLSDQTSCHVPYDGGYCPVGLTFEERTRMLHENPAEFRRKVDATLKRHFLAIKELVGRGTYFFDYGNSFMKAVYDAGVPEIARNGSDKNGFIFPSYVEDIMGPELFDYGYGPFRWVCLSGKHEDLVKTDRAAMECIDPTRRGQDLDNYNWIRDAEKNNLVVGTQARILYQDAEGRMKIALRFNEMVRRGEVGPIMLGRDHHDVSGTDSPFRETSNIKDGSNVMADMAVQCFAGNCARGMSLVALHNGGGVGIGKAVNGGFGMVCDGSERVDEILRSAMLWDVMGGVARRSWARNAHAMETSEEFNRTHAEGYHITMPYVADEELIDKYIK